jgi:antirestriction protein ArdC
MPPFAQFKSPEAYVSTPNHELSHWSGAKRRLHRDLTGPFGGAKYTMEEIVTELSACFLCADLHIRPEPRTDHAAYLASWLTALRNDKKAIFTAASKAKEAATYLRRLASFAQQCAS